MKKCFYRVTVGGVDISARLRPILISLTVTDKKGVSSDTADIEIDDTGGTVVMPAIGAMMEIDIGWGEGATARVFSGKVDEVRSKFGRSAGRTLSITAKGVDSRGRAKEPQIRSMDRMSLQSALVEAGRDAGVTDIRVDSQFRSIVRDWWGMDAESFQHFGERLAREVGGIFKISGNRAVLAREGSGTSPSGAPLPTITAAAARNLIEWDIAPQMGRSQWRETRGRYYDSSAGRWRDTRVQVPTEGAEASATRRHPAPNQGEAQSGAESDRASAEKNKGGGRVTIDGEAAARPEGTCIVQGARPGIDGAYRIDSVEHSVNRSAGWLTRLELKQPAGSAGRDSRRSR